MPEAVDPARTLLGEILAVVNRHQGNASSANQAMQEIEDVISTSMDALTIRAASSPSGATGQEGTPAASSFHIHLDRARRQLH